MGESFLGLPNRFKVIDNLLEPTFDPNHVLSAYQGYRLSKDYVKRTGGEEYKMEGALCTEDIFPNSDIIYGNQGSLNGSDIGKHDKRYRYVYAMYYYGETFSGNAVTASKLKDKVKLSITGSVTGTTSFDGSGNIELNVSTNHNHDGTYLPLTGGSMKGNIKLDGYGIGITDKNGRLLFSTDSSYITHIGQGLYIKNTGGIRLYSNNYLDIYTKQNEIRLNIESSSVGLIKPYISIGADATGAYMKCSKNAARLYLKGGNELTYNDYTIYHSGNLKLTDYSPSNHNHDDQYLLLTGGSMKGDIRFISSKFGIKDIYNGRILGYDISNSSMYVLMLGETMKDNADVKGKVELYSRQHPVSITSYDSYEVLKLNSKGAPSITFSMDANGSRMTSQYYDEGGRLNTNYIYIPGKAQDNLRYNGNTVYHSGNLDINSFAPLTHTHDYISNSDKYSPNKVTHSNYNINQGRVPTLNFISYWNGAYNADGKSNLAFCSQGAFGSIITHSSDDYLSVTGGTVIGNLTVNGGLTLSKGTYLKSYGICPPQDQACVRIFRTGGETLSDGSTSNFLDAAIDDIASDRIVPSSIYTGINTSSGSRGVITIGIDKASTLVNKGLHVKIVTQRTKVRNGSTIVGGAYDVTDTYAPIFCNGTKNPSDIRLKKDIHEINMSQSIRIISKLTPVSYSFKEKVDKDVNRGIIAQQLKEIMLSERCDNQIYSNSDEGTLMVNYEELIPDIINVLKYLLYKVDKDSYFDDISKSLKLDEYYYREHAEEIAKK